MKTQDLDRILKKPTYRCPHDTSQSPWFIVITPYWKDEGPEETYLVCHLCAYKIEKLITERIICVTQEGKNG